MHLYDDLILPPLIDLAMRSARLRPYRARVAGAAEGRVLEIGIGSGRNLPFYGPRVGEVIGLDPSTGLLARARAAAGQAAPPLRLVSGTAEAIPLDARSIDTIVMTWAACSIPRVADMRRVLRPGGRLVFVEHGLAPDPPVARWQERLTPVWRRLSGGCHLDRRIDRLVAEAGFRVDRLDCAYLPGPRILTYFYEGTATPR